MRGPSSAKANVPGRRSLQPRTSTGASGSTPPNWHTATESAWALRTRAERERSRPSDPLEDTPTSELGGAAYDQATADVEPDAARPKPTFTPASHYAAAVTPIVSQAAAESLAGQSARTPGTEATNAPANEVLDADVVARPRPIAPAESSAPPQTLVTVDAPERIAREMTTGSLLNGRYLLGRLLGSGGGSLIFQAEDRRRIGAEDFGSKIAIKVLRPEMRHNSHALTRLKREFRQMQRLTHPGVARVFELGCDEDIWFMTMELIDGQTINEWLKSSTSRTASLQIIAGCCEALSHAHETGIVHGDLKPSNVLVLTDGEVKLVDFGSAAERDATTGEVEKERSFAATPPYASPQVLAGEIADPRDDVFSLACLSYAVLTHGEHPFERKSSAEAQQAHMKPAYSRALLTRQFEVIVRALSWGREHRPATVREFWHALLASDLRRDPASRETGTASADTLSKPIPNTPTRDAPTVAATKAETKTQVQSQAVSDASAPVHTQQAPKRETIKHEDIVRLKAAIAAAEAHADRIEHPKTRSESEPPVEPPVDPLAKFRGYVAGPMAPHDDEASIGIAPAPSEPPPKRSKRLWPWQRFALIVAIGVAGALAFAATQLDSDPGTTAPSQTRSVAKPKPAMLSPTLVVATTPSQEPAPPVDEKKSPQIAVTGATAPPAPAEISFATRTLRVGVGQTIAALSVKRLNSTRGRARVAWTIEGGTARAGVDYVVGSEQVIEFLEGQSVRSLFIPLVAEKDAEEARSSKTFTVKLQPTNGGPSSARSDRFT